MHSRNAFLSKADAEAALDLFENQGSDPCYEAVLVGGCWRLEPRTQGYGRGAQPSRWSQVLQPRRSLPVGAA